MAPGDGEGASLAAGVGTGVGTGVGISGVEASVGRGVGGIEAEGTQAPAIAASRIRARARATAAPRSRFIAREGWHERRNGAGWRYSALTAATRSARPCFASANSMPVLGFTYSSLSMPA